jgi:O-antigen/teichoic acid export membrane protein
MLKKIIANFTALFTGEAIARICHFFTIIYIARVLGAQGFGAINFSLAIISYFLMTTNIGLSELGVREVARKKDTKEKAETILSIRFSLACFSFLTVLFIAFFLNKSPYTVYLLIAYGFTLFPYALSVEWVFRGIEKMKYNAYGRIINAFMYLGLIFALVKKPSDIVKVAMIAVLTDFITCIFYYANYRKRFGSIRFHLDLKRWFSLLPVSFQLFVSSALLIMYLNFGIIALGFIKNEQAVGIYSAAYKIAFLFYALSDVMVAAAFPVVSRFYHESREKFQVFMNYCIKATVSLGLPIAVGGLILGPRIIKITYGSSYSKAGPLLQIMSWFAAINLTSFILSYSLVAFDRQNKYLRILVYGLVFNIAFNLLAIHFMSYYAPSVALVLTEALVLILSFSEMKKLISVPFLRLVIRPFLCAALMSIPLLILFKLNTFVLIALGTGFYFGALVSIGGVTKHEILKFKEALT